MKSIVIKNITLILPDDFISVTSEVTNIDNEDGSGKSIEHKRWLDNKIPKIKIRNDRSYYISIINKNKEPLDFRKNPLLAELYEKATYGKSREFDEYLFPIANSSLSFRKGKVEDYGLHFSYYDLNGELNENEDAFRYLDGKFYLY